MSPPSTSSYTPTVMSGGQAVRLNVITRIAIEGKAKQGEEGASIKMYMKLAVPIDSITPGSTIALFPEENVKILTSEVHPLDSNSVPYNFSSSASPLLHNAARALNLPARLPTTFYAAHHLSSSPNVSPSITSSTRLPEAADTAIPPVDPHYTGQILVSGYHIAYVLPKHFPSRGHGRFEGESERSGPSSHNKRRLSIGDRNHAHFMAAVDMWIPYVTRPPRFPYLLSIPTPRCLHNNIRLRIFPPSNTSASFASLSSLEDDANSWDLTSDPHVTRITSNHLTRAGSYNHFADDESSDSSSTGFTDGFGIRGTFPSTDRVRVRWAKPMKSFEESVGSGDARRRVGVKDVKSEMTCTVRGKSQSIDSHGTEGIVMDIEYNAFCRGIWFPGVATLLGMDVGLVAKNADVTWLGASPVEWTITGGVGFQGFNVAGAGETVNIPSSRGSSMDSQSPQVLISAANSPPMALNGRPKDSSSSNSSLLRAPLPSQNVAEYSFEGLNDAAASSSSHLGTISSVSSLSQSKAISPPGAPLTLHVNINDVLPPNKAPFTFTITGTILITPRLSLSRANGTPKPRPPLDYIETTEAVNLPHFTVLAADAEMTKIVVRNGTEGKNAVVEVYSPSGDIYKDPQTRKTVLQKGGSTRCSEGGGRIVLKIIGSRYDRIPSRSRTPTGSPEPRASPNTTRVLSLARQNRHSPHLIHSVKTVVTPLVSRHSLIPDAYAVRINLNIPVNNQTDWLEFGLARFGPGSSRTILPDDGETCSQKVHIAGASVDGVPVHYAITNTEKQLMNGETLEGASFETVGSIEWASWVKIQVGPSTGDNVIIDYIVTAEPTRSTWFSSWHKRVQWDLLLPTFILPIGRLEVKLESIKGFTHSFIDSNLGHKHTRLDSQRLLHFAGEELFSPRVSLRLRPAKSKSLIPWSWLLNVALFCLIFVFSSWNTNLGPRWTRTSPGHLSSPAIDDRQELATVTVTFATTITECASSSWHWINPVSSSMDSSSSSSQHTSTIFPTPTLLPATSPRSSIVGTAPHSISPRLQESLSLYFNMPLREMLGFDNLRISFESMTMPNMTIAAARETLSRYGRTIWEVVEYLLFS
ncbi:hypothetical protein AN958_08647 [Leucoagaricus sp. SymC.cos]|nr:hypothetical protein AN958_08647 [Leucoagaricus sp. SymC.cos]